MFCLLLRPSIPEADRRARSGAAGPSWTPPGPASRGQRPGGAPEGVTAPRTGWRGAQGTGLHRGRGEGRGEGRGAAPEALPARQVSPRVGKRGRTRFIRPGRRDTQAFPAIPQHVQPDTDKAGSHRRPLRGAGAHLTPLWPGPEVTGRSRSAEGLAASGRQAGAAGLGGRPEQPGHRRGARGPRASQLAQGSAMPDRGTRSKRRGLMLGERAQPGDSSTTRRPWRRFQNKHAGLRGQGLAVVGAGLDRPLTAPMKLTWLSLAAGKESENQLSKLCLICNHISS